jgi:hypothetical protein
MSDVKGLQLLKDNGFRLATLTNSPSCAKAAVNQFKFNRLFWAGLELIVLKNTNQPQKPIYGPQRTTVKPEEMLMIAAILAGASHAGLLALLPVKGSPCTLYPAPWFWSYWYFSNGRTIGCGI